jgi:hypothetical protein
LHAALTFFVCSVQQDPVSRTKRILAVLTAICCCFCFAFLRLSLTPSRAGFAPTPSHLFPSDWTKERKAEVKSRLRTRLGAVEAKQLCVVWCVVLHCVALRCVALRCAVLSSFRFVVLCCVVLYIGVLCSAGSAILYCIVLYYVVLCSAVWWIKWSCIFCTDTCITFPVSSFFAAVLKNSPPCGTTLEDPSYFMLLCT